MKIALATLATALLLGSAGKASASDTGRANPGCIAAQLRIPRELAPHLPDRAYLRYEVTPEGKVRRLEVAPEAWSPRLARLLSASLRQCRADSRSDTPPGQYALALRFEP